MRFEVAISPALTAPKECAQVDLSGPDDFCTQLYVDFTTLFRRIRQPSEAALDFLLVASVVYALDKLVSRSSAIDLWSRSFEVAVPVREPRKWNRLTSTVNDCLGFLTGDEWNVTFSERQHSLVRRRRRKRRTRIRVPPATGSTVCLFSG